MLPRRQRRNQARQVMASDFERHARISIIRGHRIVEHAVGCAPRAWAPEEPVPACSPSECHLTIRMKVSLPPRLGMWRDSVLVLVGRVGELDNHCGGPETKISCLGMGHISLWSILWRSVGRSHNRVSGQTKEGNEMLPSPPLLAQAALTTCSDQTTLLADLSFPAPCSSWGGPRGANAEGIASF